MVMYRRPSFLSGFYRQNLLGCGLGSIRFKKVSWRANLTVWRVLSRVFRLQSDSDSCLRPLLFACAQGRSVRDPARRHHKLVSGWASCGRSAKCKECFHVTLVIRYRFGLRFCAPMIVQFSIASVDYECLLKHIGDALPYL